jgi:hypothetical protein
MTGALLSPPNSPPTKKSRPRPKPHKALASLADRLPSLFAVSTFDAQPRDYLPEPCIRGLITRTAIEGELKKESTYLNDYDEDQRQELLEWIFAYAPKVFAITLQCDATATFLLDAISMFMDAEFDDSKLPIDDPKPPPPALPPARLPAFDDLTRWTDFKYYKFYKEQWTCLAPIFPPGKYAYDEYPECIFPFQVDGAIPKVGAFSSVYRVKIHDDHQSDEKLRDVSQSQRA